MPEQSETRQATASVEQRVAAIEAAFDERGMKPAGSVEELERLADEQ